MRSFTFCLLLVPALGFSQVTGEWKPSKEDPVQIARNADDRVRSARNCSVATKLQLVHKNTGDGGDLSEGAFGPNGEFRMAYPIRTGPSMRGYTKVEIISDGKQYVLTGAAVTNLKVLPISAKKMIQKDFVASWFGDFPRLIWASLGSKEYPLAEATIQFAKEGYSVKMDTREVKFGGKTMSQYRIHIQTTPAQTKKMGSRDWEVLIDGARKFPVKVNAIYQPIGSPEERVTYDLLWNLKAGQKFPPSTFVVKKKS